MSRQIENFTPAQQNQIKLAGKNATFLEKLDNTCDVSTFRGARICLENFEDKESKKKLIALLNNVKNIDEIEKIKEENVDILTNYYVKHKNLPSVLFDKTKNQIKIYSICISENVDFNIFKDYDLEDEKTRKFVRKALSLYDDKKDIPIEYFLNLPEEVVKYLVKIKLEDASKLDFVMENKDKVKDPFGLMLLYRFNQYNLDIAQISKYNKNQILLLHTLFEWSETKFYHALHLDKDILEKFYKKDISDDLIDILNPYLKLNNIDLQILVNNLSSIINFSNTHDKSETKLFTSYVVITNKDIDKFDEFVDKLTPSNVVPFAVAKRFNLKNFDFFLETKVDLSDLIDLLSKIKVDTDPSYLFKKEHNIEQLKTIFDLFNRGFKEFDTNPSLSPNEIFAKAYLDKWGVKVEKDYEKTFIDCQKEYLDGINKLSELYPEIMGEIPKIVVEKMNHYIDKNIER